MSQIRNAVLIACSLAVVSGAAWAQDDAVIHRLTSHGGLSSSAAKKLAAKVSQSMAKAADAPPAVPEPLRAALSQALLGTPVPPDQMSAAKVRLKLYAGLNEQALEALFHAQPGAIAACVRDVGASESECEALVAAAAGSSVAKIRSLAGGPAPAPAGVAPAYGSAAPAAPSRFGRFNSGYHPPARGYQGATGYRPSGYGYQGYGQQAYRPPAYGARPSFGGQGYQRPAYAPAQGYRPAAQAYRPAAPAQPQPQPQQAYRPAAPAQPAYQPAAPVVTQQQMEARKEAYKRKREAYIARQKAEFEARKARAGVNDASDDNESAPPAHAAASSSSKSHAKVAGPAQEVAAADTKRPAAAAPAPAPKSESKPAALDNSFLDGLLDDPLGGGKKGK